jgi:uncharacterized membrane protein YeiH
MPAHALGHGIQNILELIGLYAFATSGALMAIRKGFDAVGIVILAEITALGGGVARDLAIGATPPAAFINSNYLLIPVVAAAMTFFAHPVVEKLNFAILVFDAAGLALFCVTGTSKALEYDLGMLAAVTLGVTTAVGGGLMRDVIARETPALVRVEAELYSVPATAGAAIVAATYDSGLSRPFTAIGGAVFVFLFRLVAMIRHWHAPQAWKRRDRSGPEPGSTDRDW